MPCATAPLPSQTAIKNNEMDIFTDGSSETVRITQVSTGRNWRGAERKARIAE